jgi:hypothetical protein
MVLVATFNPAAGRLDPVYESDQVHEIHVNLVQGTYAKGTILGELTATPGTFKPYANANSDGSETAKLILRYACTVDAQGNIVKGDELELPAKSIDAIYRGGTWKTSELVGLDAAAVVDLHGTLISGTLANGYLKLG